MSLRAKLTGLLVVLVAAAVLLAWLVAGRVMAPFAHEVMEVYLDQAVFVAERVAAGEPAEALGKKLGLEIHVREKPPEAPGRMGAWRRRACNPTEREGHKMIVCPGPRAPVSVETAAGWVTLKRDLDVAGPPEKIGPLLLLVLLGLVAVSVYVAGVAAKPLKAATLAMSRVADGDLEHRLAEEGKGELADAGRAFNKMTERVRKMLETERALMAGISHELRTPLARLRLEVELLRDRNVPETRLSAMDKDLEEMDRLIGELLESSRLSLGERTIERQPVDLVEVAEEATRRVDLGGRKVEIKGAAVKVQGDHDRLVRVVTNLLTNAAKYAPADKEIELEVEGASLRVKDRGPGVPESALPRLFEPFYRVGGTSAGGLGLGLMIAQQIVGLHGGSIGAKNREGGGLEVFFSLPTAP
ncbi:MAG: HAMP domain-containing sensor histidine kinase [Myxococcota bacterium]